MHATSCSMRFTLAHDGDAHVLCGVEDAMDNVAAGAVERMGSHVDTVAADAVLRVHAFAQHK